MDMAIKKKLQACFEVILAEAETNEAFGRKLSEALGEATEPAMPAETGKKKRSNSKKRDPAVLDPIQMAADGDDSLQGRLEALSEKELKDIIAQYGLDLSKTAMRWRKRERLIQLILDTSAQRATKGDAFRG